MKTDTAVKRLLEAAEVAEERGWNDLAARLRDHAERLETAPPDPQGEEKLNA